MTRAVRPYCARGAGASLNSMGFDRNGLEILDRERCLGLLDTVELGRVALSDKALPIIVPVEFWMLGDDIVFRASGGLLATAARQGHVVCFEADSGTAAEDSWSVLVIGGLTVADPSVVATANGDGRAPWRTDVPGETVQLSTTVMSGRLLTPAGAHRP